MALNFYHEYPRMGAVSRTSYENEALDSGLLLYIEKKTRNPLQKQLSFYKEIIHRLPKEVIVSVRGLAETTVEYLYRFISGEESAPDPYWCLVWRGNDYDRFEKACLKAKSKHNPYPEDCRKMWEANQLLQRRVSGEFIKEANYIRNIGNMATHNKCPEGMDLSSEAERCMNYYDSILNEVNHIITQGSAGKKRGTRNAAEKVVRFDVAVTKTATVAVHDAENTEFDVKKWFANLQSKLALERLKTQEDYDMEDLIFNS